ncbi:hypothetical protein C0J52_24419 [Blattella germanica]|nr:hypothetical protein C0J52_24419 [Blattella germanica]
MGMKYIILFCALCVNAQPSPKRPDFIDAIMDIVERIEAVTKMTVDMANTIKSLGDYSDEKWGYDFFKIQLKTAAIYKKVIEYSRRNAEIDKIKEAAKDFQKTSITNVEMGMVNKLRKLIDSSLKTKKLAEKLYDLMEPYKLHTYPEDYAQLRAIQKKVDMTVGNVYYVLDTTFEFLNYIDKRAWCTYILKVAPHKAKC